MAQVTATVGIKNSAFKRGLDAMRSEAQSWASDIKGTIAGAFVFGSVMNWFNNFREQMGRVQDLADRFGQSTKAIQQVGNVAKVSGTDLEQLSTVLTKLTLEAGKSAEKFERVGINVADFAAAGYDQQILMLAAAWERANGDTEKQLALMQLLGDSGQNLLPMLSKGVKQLTEEFAAVPVVSDAAVASMSRFNDFLDGMITKSHEAAGALVGLRGQLGAATAALFQSGDFTENYAKNIEGLLDQKPTAQAPKTGITSDADQKAAEDEDKKAAEAIARLDEEMIKLARSRMTEEQKITDLKREQAEHAARAQDKTQSDADRAAAATEVLRIQQEIEAAEKRIAATKDAEAKKAADKKKSENEAAVQAETRLAEEQRKQRLDKMDPKSRIEELKREQKALNESAANDPDRKSAAEKKLKALELNREIDSAQKALEEKSPTLKARNPSVISSSLGAIGGGGGVFVNAGTDPLLMENRRQTSLLQQIARNTTTTGGMPGSPATNPF